MASCKDTSTFFSKGNCSQYEHVLKLYPQCLKLRASKRAKKPEELVKLDNWYQNELPVLIKSRGKDAHLIHDELVQTMKWKQTRGKFYPQLSYLVKVNTPRAVMVETKKAFKKLPNLEQAMTALCNLKGVGTTMASALLAAAAPEIAPFMADECLSAIPDIEGIDYTTKRYLIFVQHIHSVVDRLNKEGRNGTWSHHQVELALWTHFVANEMKPELLDDLPGFENGAQRHGNGAAKEGVDSDSSQEPGANGKHLDVLEDSTTSFNDDSVDKADFLGTDSADKVDSLGTDSADKGDFIVGDSVDKADSVGTDSVDKADFMSVDSAVAEKVGDSVAVCGIAKPAPGAEEDSVARDGSGDVDVTAIAEKHEAAAESSESVEFAESKVATADAANGAAAETDDSPAAPEAPEVPEVPEISEDEPAAKRAKSEAEK